ncbi:hypothetical protein KY362_04845 [Candidatus Woesearchaeota archaeon]|nr:hypothetical protein [Candidatus Woesearchaeota archaeon]
MAKEEKGGKKDDDPVSDKERVDKGQLLARIVIEVLGAPKDHVEEAIKLVVDRAHKIKGAEVVSESTYEAEQKEKLFSTFSEIEIWFDSMDVLMQFIFDFTPSSVEIMQPAKVEMKANHVSGFFNDFLLKMHELGLKLKDLSAKTQLLGKNTDTLMRNFLHHVLETPRSADELSKVMGIPKENIAAILENFEKAGIVENKDDLYSLVDR